MKPIDKFGNPIPTREFNILQAAAWHLEALGYTEHPEHTNLFSFHTNPITFYADMRGTEDVPIDWVPVPMFYFHLARNAALPVKDYKYRAALIEVRRLGDMDLRMAFPAMSEMLMGGPFGARLSKHFTEQHRRIFAQYKWYPRTHLRGRFW